MCVQHANYNINLYSEALQCCPGALNVLQMSVNVLE